MTQIPGYTYGQASVARSPVTLRESLEHSVVAALRWPVCEFVHRFGADSVEFKLRDLLGQFSPAGPLG